MSYEVLVTAGISGPPGGEVPYFDTAQDLRDYAYPTEGGVAVTLGSLAVDDKGGGYWRWDSSSTEDDNLGMVLCPTGYAGIGRWVRQHQYTLYPEMFGAIGDGVTDDSEAIQAWINAVAYGKLTVTAKKHYLCQDILFPQLNDWSLDGSGAVFSPVNNDHKYVFGNEEPYDPPIMNARIESLHIDGRFDVIGQTTGVGTGLRLNSFDGVYCGDLIIENTSGHGLNLIRINNSDFRSILIRDSGWYGLSFDATKDQPNQAYSRFNHFGKIHTINCGWNKATDWWAGVNFDDTSPTSGISDTTIDTLIGIDGARHALGLGRNADTEAGDLYGPVNTKIGTLIMANNTLSGCELYANVGLQIDSIISHNNGSHGVYIRPGDRQNNQPTDIQIGRVLTYENANHGIFILSPNRVQIGEIIARDNGQEANFNNRSNVLISSILGDPRGDMPPGRALKIGSIVSDNAQGTANYGFKVEGSSWDSESDIEIGSIRARNSNLYDLSLVRLPPVKIGTLNIGTQEYLYSTAGPREDYLVIGDRQVSTMLTHETDFRSLMVIPVPAHTEGLIEIDVVGRCLTSSERYAARLLVGYVNTYTTAPATAPVIRNIVYAYEQRTPFEDPIVTHGCDVVGRGVDSNELAVRVLASTEDDFHWTAFAKRTYAEIILSSPPQ